jgi:hypothetical protein
MRPNPLVLTLALLGSAWTSTASAEIGAMDPVPSATLLFPYFEADTAGTTRDTLLTIENTSAAPQLAHVVVWSDRGVPVHDFDLYLTAHAQQTIGMRALLMGQRPTSAAGASVPGCSFPLNTLGSSVTADLAAALTGQHIPSVANANLGCPGADHGDAIARGYVTVDTVTACSTTQVTTGTYWGTQLATANTLLGHFVMTQGADRPAYAEQAVHIEASTTDPRVDEATFYGALVGYNGADARERLPTQWSVEAAATRSDVIVWRETKRTETDPAAVGCSAAAQSALDLEEGSLNFFSEAEAFTQYGTGGTTPFVFAAGRHPVGGAEGLPMPYRSGMFTLHTNFPAAGDPASAMGLGQSVVLSARYPDAIGTPTHGTLSFGTPIDDGFDPTVAGNPQPTSDYFMGGNVRPIAMLDPRAAASLVLPYFEVSLDEQNEAQTQFSIVNNTASAGLALVTLFTDRGVPTRTFNVYLTGYDMAVVDLRMLFLGGLDSRSASDGQDPQDTITPQGPISQDINFASCYGSLPAPVLDADAVAFLRAAHTGQPTDEWGGSCGGRALGDGVARGYIVIDDLTQCLDHPVSENDIASNALGNRDNFSGSFEVRNRNDDFSYGGPLIALHEVSPLLSAGDMTFYGWLGGWPISGPSRREALPNKWRVPFLNSAATGTTELIVFRPVHRTATPYACNAVPGSFAGGVASLTAYDVSQNSTAVAGFVPGFVAGRVPVGAGGIVTPYASGSLEIDLDFVEADAPASPVPGAHMGFIGAVHRVAGSSDPVFSQGFPLQLAGQP